MGKTSIQWTEHSVNPIRARTMLLDGSVRVGHYCAKVSPGCKNCYASRLQPRFGLPVFQDQRAELEPELFLDTKVLASVLRRKKPTKFFWCDMTDMFGDWVPYTWIAACLFVMAMTPQHTHQVLTKRSARMREWFLMWAQRDLVAQCAAAGAHKLLWDLGEDLYPCMPWYASPLPNVVLMVSAENQEQADLRIPDLLATPAAVRGVSVEPQLGPVDLSIYLARGVVEAKPGDADYDAIQWVIGGGESGPKARPYDLAWGRALRDQCATAGVPYFQKQVGAHPVLGETIIPRGKDGGRWPKDRAGGDPAEWPADMRVREFPGSATV